jgi:hypothetical protein
MPRASKRTTTIAPLDALFERLGDLERDIAGEMSRVPARSRAVVRGRRRVGAKRGKAGSGSLLQGLEREIGKRVRGVLERLDVSTRADIEGFTARIADLEQHLIAQLKARREGLGAARLRRSRSNRRRNDG